MWQLICDNCAWQQDLDTEAAATRLRLIGVLRREQQPDASIVGELLDSTSHRMTCPTCNEIGLEVRETDDADNDQWQTASLCEICRKPIPAERIEALPQTTRCVDCQDSAERGDDVHDEVEFCPQCGALLQLRVSRGGGITRYKQFCTGVPPCRI